MQRVLTSILIMIVHYALPAHGEQNPGDLRTTYVSLYSHIYYGDALRPFNLAATVSVRNISRADSFEIVSVEYFNSDGKKIRDLESAPITVPPLAAKSFKVKQSDVEGGSGASVLVHWRSNQRELEPLIESIMIGTSSGQGISFTSRGVIMKAQPAGSPERHSRNPAS